MVQMKTLASHTFADKLRRPGDTYQAQDSEATLVQALGWAEPVVTVTSEAAPKRRQYRRRDMKAQH